jgi:TolB protein
MNNIEELERRYQILSGDFQAGKIDEATFTSSVDQLQFQDEWGRYWMIGAQTGAWHYYDGQAWHQADPREADKLPFMDDQGRYWQRGAKSGDWYYYQPETGEWVKPSPDEGPPSPAVYGAGRAGTSYYHSHLQQQNVDTGPSLPSQFEGELYQDDDGRYWAVGGKTGQWYFYEHDGWHPAHEFQPAVPAQPSYQSPGFQTSPSFTSQPYQYQAPPAYYQQPGSYPAQAYAQPPIYSQPAQPYPAEQVSQQPPVQPQAEPAAPGPDQGMPRPPTGDSQSGSWYYFDGKQWLKYSSGEPEEAPPADPKMVLDQQSEPAKAKTESKSEPVVAEFFEDDEPPAEVVDVEVITVVEAEPDEDEPEPKVKAAPSPKLVSDEDVRPRRSRRPSDVTPASESPAEPQQERTLADPGRQVVPRRKDTTGEPSIIIPTGVAASGISSNRTASRPVSRAVESGQHRPRESTMPMEPTSRPAPSTPANRRHGEITQAMPTANRARADTAPVKTSQPARQATQPIPAPAPAAPVTQAAEAAPRKRGYTLGDILRSFPSTIWTLAGGIIVLLMFAFLIVAAWAWLNQGDFNLGSVAVAPSPTPTLAQGPPDATPTLAPTPDVSSESAATSAPAEAISFSSDDLGITLEYPETWHREEAENLVIFSPSEEGLDSGEFKDTALWIGIDDNSAISDLLADALSQFPAGVDNLNEGTINIASQTWTSTQIRFDDDNLGGQGIATLAVTGRDGMGYKLIAVAPAKQWNSMQPVFQEMINSFRFGGGEIAQAAEEPSAAAGDSSSSDSSSSSSDSSDSNGSDEETAAAAPTTASRRAEATATPAPPTPTSTPTIQATATPLVYVIQSGDTLLAIANQFGVSVDLLASKNGIQDPGALSIGQELVIPFTAEELAAYNASGSAAPAPSSSDAESAAEAAAEETPAEEAEQTAPASAASSAAAPAAEEPAAAPPPSSSSSPAASISGKIIYPAFNPGTNTYDLWLADVTSGEQTGLVSEASQPAFNRDGSLLAYRSWSLGTRGIFFRDFIGGRGGQVTRFVEDGLPVWSPDGLTFIFASRREGDRVPRLYVGDQMGENDYSIDFQGEYPSVFPDGRVVSRGCLPSGDCGVFVVGPRGGGETKISADRSDTATAVSPDGSKIAFMSSGRGASNWEIFVMNADGSNAKRLTDNGNNDGLPAWSPDGRSIAYVSDQGGAWAIWVMNADGSNQRKLFNMKGSPDGSVLQDRDNSRGWLEERISWAP